MSPDDDDFLRIMSNATFYQGVTLPSGKFLTHEEHEALKALGVPRRGKGPTDGNGDPLVISSAQTELDATLKAISDEIEELKRYTGLSRRRIPRPKKPVDPLLLDNWLEKPEGWPGWPDTDLRPRRHRQLGDGAWTLRDGRWVDDDKIPLNQALGLQHLEQAKREAKQRARKVAAWEAERAARIAEKAATKAEEEADKAEAEADKIAQDLLDKAKPPAWDPLGVAPFAWDLPEPGPAPAPRPSGAKRVVTAVRNEGFVVNIYAVLVLLYFSLTILSLTTGAWVTAGIDVFIMLLWMSNVRSAHKNAVQKKQKQRARNG